MNDLAPSTAEILLEDRICPKCGKTKPASAFQSINSIKCKRCNERGGKTARIRNLKNALANLASRQIIASVRGDRIDAPRISQVCAKMVELFGGMDKFCVVWHGQIKEVINERPGSMIALSQLRSIAKLIKDSTASVDSSSEITSLTDDELDDAISSVVNDAVSQIVSENALGDAIDANADELDAADDEVDDDIDN